MSEDFIFFYILAIFHMNISNYICILKFYIHVFSLVILCYYLLLFVHNISSFLVTFARFYLKNSDACMSDVLVKIVKVINVTAHIVGSYIRSSMR